MNGVMDYNWLGIAFIDDQLTPEVHEKNRNKNGRIGRASQCDVRSMVRRKWSGKSNGNYYPQKSEIAKCLLFARFEFQKKQVFLIR